MKKFSSLIYLLTPMLALSGCSLSLVKTSDSDSTTSTSTSVPSDTQAESVSDVDWGDANDITGEFSLLNESGQESGFSVSGSTYTINTAGTYILSGKLEGQVVVDAGENDTIELDLEGVAIGSNINSPIYIKNADKIKIKAKKDTKNYVVDSRNHKTADSDEQGEGAIAAKCDIHLIGNGSLEVNGNYNNGVHTSKDLKIKNLSLKSIGYNNAIRGGNSISIFNTSTYVYAVALTGDALKSNDASVSGKGNQKGTISITGGNVVLHAQTDGIDAAYNVEISEGVEDDDTSIVTSPVIKIYTDKYATLSSSTSASYAPPGGGGPGGWDDDGNTDKSATTAKGIKAANEVNISGGNIYMKTYDDGIHAFANVLTDSDDQETGVTGTGNINISGGYMEIDSSDDGIHADKTLTISGGNINVTNSYEGIEGWDIYVTGGKVYAYAKDDGMNAGGDKTSTNHYINISGGYVEIEVPTSGDTDGVDSNGYFTISGGILIAKGPGNNGGAAALDSERNPTISGGTLIVLGTIERSFSTSLTKYNVSLHSSGSHTVNIGGTSYSFTNKTSYSKTICYSDVAVS